MFKPMALVIALLGVITAIGPSAVMADTGDQQDQAHSKWLTSFAEAQRQAKEKNKRILIKFTGSDWCPPCKYMWDNILSKTEFQNDIEQDYVLLYLDFPRRKMLSETQTKQNHALAQIYGVTGFPTIMIIDAEGREQFSTTGLSHPIQAAEYKAWIEAAEQSYKEDMARLTLTQGIDRAKLLDKLLESPARFKADQARAFKEEILRLTPQNTEGLNRKYTLQMAYDEMMGKFRRNEVKSEAEAHLIMDTFIRDYQPDGVMLQRVLMRKASYYQRQRDVIKTYETYKLAYLADPESPRGKDLAPLLPRMKQAADVVRNQQQQNQ